MEGVNKGDEVVNLSVVSRLATREGSKRTETIESAGLAMIVAESGLARSAMTCSR